MLRALLERGIVPDVVIGTSAGALNGAGVAYAPNLTGVAQLAAVWEQLRAEQVFPGGKIHRAWNVVRRGTHLFENTGLAALIDHATPARSFADLEIPLRVVATDLDTGVEVVLARGPLKPALLATCALPGVFPIVDHDGRRLVDGGVVNSVPLWHALSGPVDRVFVLNVSAGIGERVERSPLDVVMTSFMHRAQSALRARAAARAGEHRGGRPPASGRSAGSVRLLGRARADRRGVRADVQEPRRPHGPGDDHRVGSRTPPPLPRPPLGVIPGRDSPSEGRLRRVREDSLLPASSLRASGRSAHRVVRLGKRRRPVARGP